jgi:hypothetical protein
MRTFSHHPWPDETQVPATPRPEMPSWSRRRAIRTIEKAHHRFDKRSLKMPDIFVRCILPPPRHCRCCSMLSIQVRTCQPHIAVETPTFTASIDHALHRSARMVTSHSRTREVQGLKLQRNREHHGFSKVKRRLGEKELVLRQHWYKRRSTRQ